ncbi:hypothetical protein PMAYCL1PPCAC_25869, partial [Pristionchus mayeri]
IFRMASEVESARIGDTNDPAPNTKPDGIIRWEIDNLSTLTRRWSPSMEIYGVPWRLNAETLKRPPSVFKAFAVYAYANYKNESTLWECRCTFKIIVRNIDPAMNIVHTIPTQTLNYNVNNCGTVFRGYRIMNPSAGFVNNDKVKIEMWIYVKSFSGMGCMPRFEFSDPCAAHADLTLVIEGKPVHANRQYLAIHSDFFHALFYGDFVEKGRATLKLEDIIYDEFIELLHVIYPSRKKITDDSYEYLLKLGDRFQIMFVVERVQDFLIDSDKISAKDKKKIAQQYRLRRLEESLTSRAHSTSHVEDIDFSVSQGENRSDAVLMVEGKAIYVNKQHLGMYSSAYHKLFFGNFFDSLVVIDGNPGVKGQDGFKLEKIEYKDIGTAEHTFDGMRKFNLKNVGYEKFIEF